MPRYFLDDNLLRQMSGKAMVDLSPYFAIIDASARKHNLADTEKSRNDLALFKKSYMAFTGIYYALSALQVTDKVIFDSYKHQSGNLKNAIYSSLSASAALQMFAGERSVNDISNGSFNLSDSHLQDPISILNSLKLQHEDQLERRIKAPLKQLEIIRDRSLELLIADLDNKNVETTPETINVYVHARGFIVSMFDLLSSHSNLELERIAKLNGSTSSSILVKQTEFPNQQNYETKKLNEITFEEVKADDIIGNSTAKEEILTSVCSLMHYDPVARKNPFRGFDPFLLLVGSPGCGKTMLAKYAMSMAQEIAVASKKELKVAELDFEDRWQCGPIENLKHQFREISSSAGITLVFIDEIDTKFGTREKTQIGYHKEVLGEFLRFRGNSTYPNNSNYLLIGTANQPESIDKALLDAFKILEVNGPETEQERLELLKRELKYDKVPYLRISEWTGISGRMTAGKLSGREIHNVAVHAIERYRKIAIVLGNESYSQIFSDVEKSVIKKLSESKNEFITTEKEIIESIDRIIAKRDLIEKNYLR